MIRKSLLLLGLLFPALAHGAAFQFGGVRHDLAQVVSSSGTTILTSASTQVQQVTGTAAHTIRLPDATTLKSGYWYLVSNDSTQTVTVQNSVPLSLGTISAGSWSKFYITSSATAGGNWDVQPAGTSGGGGGGALDSHVSVYGGNGFGGSSSGETAIRNFTTVADSSGSDITYTARDTTHGDKFTINTTGTYSISYADYDSNSQQIFGISINSNQLSTSVDSITIADMRGYAKAGAAQIQYYAITIPLTAGDVIRAHTDGALDGSGNWIRFTITRVN